MLFLSEHFRCWAGHTLWLADEGCGLVEVHRGALRDSAVDFMNTASVV